MTDLREKEYEDRRIKKINTNKKKSKKVNFSYEENTKEGKK
jgi:hypothetical protein